MHFPHNSNAKIRTSRPPCTQYPILRFRRAWLTGVVVVVVCVVVVVFVVVVVVVVVVVAVVVVVVVVVVVDLYSKSPMRCRHTTLLSW